MSSEEGEVEVDEEEEWEADNNKQAKIKKKKAKPKKNKKEAKPFQFISSTYRKEKCEFYNKGNCTKGNLCTYSHDFEPDTAKKICKFYLSGSCSKGNQCQYSHNTKIYPCKFFHIQNRCNLAINCRFSHGPISPDFYQEYMKDNKDFILKLYKQGKLPNKNFMEFIESDLPKKQATALPMMPIAPTISPINVVTKTESNMVWTNALKKDPRQRMKPKPEEAIAPSLAQTKNIVKQEQEKHVEIKVQSLDEKLLKNLNMYFYSYY